MAMASRLRRKRKISLNQLTLLFTITSFIYVLWVLYCNVVLHQGGFSTMTKTKHLIHEFKIRPKPKLNSKGFGILSIPIQPVPLAAYIEKYEYYISSDRPDGPFKDSFENPKPPNEFAIPLPLRTQVPSDLRKVTYPKVSSCNDLPHNFPVDPGFAKSKDGEHLLVNVENKKVIFPNHLEEILPYNPVDSDPFLPWIHDVFSSQDGKRVEFIAQNKRRCNTGSNFFRDIWNLEAQIALIQPIALKRVRNVPVELWDDGLSEEERFKLSTIEEADPDGNETRFLCQFHAGTYSKITLSQYHYNMEYINWRESMESMLTSWGKDNSQFWLSTQQYYCPIPDELQEYVLSGEIEGRVHLDLVPVRTAPRFGELFSKELTKESNFFNASTVWKGHVLPKIGASGRWANIPVCSPPKVVLEDKSLKDNQAQITSKYKKDDFEKQTKPHFLVACMWVSSSYATRHDEVHLNDIPARLREWIEFHLMVGMDHFYIYDNSVGTDGENKNNTLSFLVDIFGADKITHIPWPHRVCNNNRNHGENKGERSSQYAAESSCRERYGPLTEWMTTVDPDEYMIPMGNYSNLKDMLKDVKIKQPNINIVSFKCTRAMLRYDNTVPYYSKQCSKKQYPQCLMKDPAKTFLATYNCHRLKEFKSNPMSLHCAKKQIYNPEYVLSHFIHYSPVTMIKYEATFRRRHPREKNERDTDEVNEAVMIHTKSIAPIDTKGWYTPATKSNQLKIGFPYPITESSDRNKEGFLYNCWKVEGVDDVWVPKLEKAMKKRV